MNKKMVILDGGMSRELIRLGAELRQPEWSALALIDAPDIVRQVHCEFIQAGADVITTNSYALVPFHIGEERFRSEGLTLIEMSGMLARQAADGEINRKITVAGSLPPIFGSYEPQLFDPLRAQEYLSVLVQGLSPYVDAWLGETLSLIAEGEAVRTAIAATGKPFWISFTLDDSVAAIASGEATLRSGESVADAAEWLAGSGATTLLFNCSQPEVMAKAIRIASGIFKRLGKDIEIGVYANAFESQEEGGANETLHDTRKELTPELYSKFACEWAESGASMIGGCCGIGASHIHALARTLRSNGQSA